MAIWRPGKPDAPLHHSDRRSQYTREKFQKLLSDHPLLDEPFGQRLGQRRDGKFLLVAQDRRTARKPIGYATRQKPGVRLHRMLLNVKCRHSTIGYLRPVEFED